MIGDCGLSMQNINGVILPEIGYHAAKAYQRQGYTKEAAAAARDWAFTHAVRRGVFLHEKGEYSVSRHCPRKRNEIA